MPESVSAAQVHAMLEYRVPGAPRSSRRSIRGGFEVAARWNIKAVLTTPEHVRTAREVLLGTDVKVVTMLDLTPDTPTAEVVRQIHRAVRDGATELSVPGSAPSALPDVEAFTDRVGLLTGLVTGVGARTRLVLDTEGVTDDHLDRVCRGLADTGVHLVQAGRWQGSRPSFRQLLTMREALGSRPLLKWSQPMRRVDTLLTCVAAGVDRFDVDDLSTFARHVESYASRDHLVVPPCTIPTQAGRRS